MTLFNVTTTYTAGGTLTAWPDGDVTNYVALAEDGTIPGRFTGVLDDSYGNVWYAFDGTSAPTTYDPSASNGPKFSYDLREGTPFGSSVIFTGTQVERVNGTTIVVFKDEATPVTVTLSTGSFTGLTLRFAVEDRSGTDVLVIENGSITRTSSTFTVTIPSSITGSLGSYAWSMRDITGGVNTVLLHGVLSVRYAAGKDA